MSDNLTFKGGLDLKFFQNSELEELTPHSSIETTGRNFLRVLMMGWPKSASKLVSWAAVKGLFIQRNHDLLRGMRFAFQEGFEHLFTQLKGRQLNKLQLAQVQFYLSNCLSFLPYSDLTPFESIKIPEHIDGHWELVEYAVTPIELTMGLHDEHKDYDSVFAYGLEAINHPKAQSHLIFMGTTYPSGQGFLPQIHTNLEASETVGHSLYFNGRGLIKDWLLKQKQKVHVCGTSLGGALGLLLAMDLGNYLSRVDALNPPGLYKPNKLKYDNWEKFPVKPKILIQMQANDPISSIGVWKKDWQLLRVIPPKNKKGPNGFCDHILNYAGFAETEFSHISVEEENLKRKNINFWIYTVGRTIFYSVFNSLIKPAVYLFKNNNKTSVALSFLAAVVFSTLILLTLGGVITPLFLWGSIASTAICGLLYNFSEKKSYVSAPLKTMNVAALHHPALPRNRSMDIYNHANLIDATFTHKEINTYYKAIRCLVKQKQLIPTENKLKQKHNYASKKDLLLACQNPENESAPVTFKTTKAKALHMRRTLTLIDQLGVENEQQLKQTLKKEYDNYCLGKN